MKEGVSCSLMLQLTLLFLLGLHKSRCSTFTGIKDSGFMKIKVDALSPVTSSGVEPRPFLPLLAPSPLPSFTNDSLPKLSGLCSLDLSAAEDIMSTTASNCWATFAPYLANVVCCPQFHATLVILIGQTSKKSGVLALNTSHATHCLSDVEKILVSQGANENLQNVCSIHPENLTKASCPTIVADDFETIVDSSILLTACGKLDPVSECCDQFCQNAILDAARKIALKGMSNLDWDHTSSEQTTRINNCKNIVLRWLAMKLDPSSANTILRGLSNCKLNKAMESYVSDLQEQSLVTNLQALSCAASLGMKLQKANVSNNVYNLCHISLKDFSLQVGSQESGCLLPSLPSDATYDKTSGIGFICDLNDHITAPWPSMLYVPASSCSKSMKLPAMPSATSAQNGVFVENLVLRLLFTFLLVDLGILYS
ncbi:GPI-anchored protein [Quillaja saponaria]|uniref:GPI-anchored protein n=1 Tax=Quillaja saponaria TaxID=32244 RepID=A0AAD7KYK1_QUISA|nr:GPI-anchored protein [Quillaja saponaria]